MNYAVIKYVNGSYEIAGEFDDKKKAVTFFHSVCATLSNAEDVVKATVILVDSQFSMVKYDIFEHEVSE